MPEWDVFVSHASEDKDAFVTPLVASLKEHVSVWFDATEIQAGDSIREKIDLGLANSRWGVVVLSRNFFSAKKRWTSSELGALFSTNKTRIIPVWLRISKELLFRKSPLLADIAAYNAKEGAERIANFIVQRITHRTIYYHTDYLRRLDALVTAKSTFPSPLYVSIGKGDFIGSWLPRLLERVRLSKEPLRISQLVILSLEVDESRRLEKAGRLTLGFTEIMLSNIETLKGVFPGSFEWRVWQREPTFHGYIFFHSAVVAKWDRDEQGHSHVMTPLQELQRDMSIPEFESLLTSFRQAKLKYRR